MQPKLPTNEPFEWVNTRLGGFGLHFNFAKLRKVMSELNNAHAVAPPIRGTYSIADVYEAVLGGDAERYVAAPTCSD